MTRDLCLFFLYLDLCCTYQERKIMFFSGFKGDMAPCFLIFACLTIKRSSAGSSFSSSKRSLQLVPVVRTKRSENRCGATTLPSFGQNVDIQDSDLLQGLGHVFKIPNVRNGCNSPTGRVNRLQAAVIRLHSKSKLLRALPMP